MKLNQLVIHKIMTSPVSLSSSSFAFLTLFLLTFHINLLLNPVIAEARQRLFNNSISAVIVFGDSTVDSGNNNFIVTTGKSNFPPYGKDFPGHIPTGRFTNGRLVTDFIASYLGVKDCVPPYLDPNLSLEELMSGVSFASGGSGFDPLTAQLTRVISMEEQLQYFIEYKRRLEGAIGKKRTKNLITKAAFLISAGTNDFVINYFAIPFRRQSFSLSEYHQFLLQQVHHFIQGLVEEGGRAIAMVGVPPLGCLPVVITLNSAANLFDHPRRHCVESLSAVARDYNRMLQNKLQSFQRINNAVKIVYGDIYRPLNDMIQNPSKFGFDDVNSGCCGSGLVGGCNWLSSVCYDASKYVFWDSVHPTEKTYYNVFQSLTPLIDFIALNL